MRIASFVPRLLLVVAILFTSTMGCNTTTVKVRLPGFGSGNIDGIWLWRLGSNGYKRSCRFDLSDPYLSGGREVVDYQQKCQDGRNGTSWQAIVQRQTNNPATVTLTLLYRPSGALSPHRATSFNTAGESALSTSMLSL